MKLLIIVLMLCSLSSFVQNSTIEKIFLKFGEYGNPVKSYYSSRDLKLHWIEAFALCRTFNMDLVELPTEAEADYFLKLCAQKSSDLNGKYFHIGASYAGLGLNEYYWMTTGQRINYTLQWAPNQPDNRNGIEYCLSVKSQPGNFMFNDINMDTTTDKWKFICQRITNANSNTTDFRSF